MTVPGDDSVYLIGENADRLVRTLATLGDYQGVLFGGLAVMARVGLAHRPTNDIDSLYNEGTVATTTLLVESGIAVKAAPLQRVVINGVDMDVIDTTPLPDDVDALPDDPKDRLFVCAHRWAYETACDLRVVTVTSEITTPVATTAALIATKAHALRYGTPNRRANKRASDLYDLYRLAQADARLVDRLDTAPWGLRTQVAVALHADLEAVDQAVSLVAAANRQTDPEDVHDLFTGLLESLA